MNSTVNAIANRLSLRQPQRDSLEILARVSELLALDRVVSGAQELDVANALNTIRSEFSTVTDFERDFPSLCFALATGVGKTRLMGAFITYLFRERLSRHFFVLAPNLTIYNKLIADFTPNTPKYVFEGIAEFATNPPELITGDNYESGRGVRAEEAVQARMFDMSPIHINIFNISKINSEVRGDKAPRIKRLSEYIGQSYFDYLAGLHDLVLLMDESHRYRATAGVKAINELKPILGLELTATPHIETGGSSVPFKNVIYSYPLSNAMKDGFVKEPAVATRENFDIKNYDDAGLEKLKLEDGVRVHENTKVELEVYARDNGKAIVKPFMLIVAKETDHANSLVKVIEDDSFFGGRYKGKVITVHSNLRGEERDETVQQLLSVESRDNPTEIVIHVNMLKEGWDVTNLYTIVPLRAANSKTLVEQSIGRGLRLPYGKRVGVPAVDRLTIVSHDRFQEIIDEANKSDSIIRTGVVIGRDIPDREMKVVEVTPLMVSKIAGDASRPEQPPLFSTQREQNVAMATLTVIKQFERLSRSGDLQSSENLQKLVERVRLSVAPVQGELAGVTEQVNVAEVVAKTVDLYIENTIDIPKIVVLPKGEVTAGYRDFTLDLKGVHLQPVAKDILIAHLQDHARYRLISGDGIVPEERLQDYLIRGLVDFNDVDYDKHADFLYKLAAQVVKHLQSYLTSEDEVRNVLQYHQPQLVSIIHSQMQDHYEEVAAEYEAQVTKGFTTLRPGSCSIPVGEQPRDVRVPVEEKLMIRGMLFGGFKKCLYHTQRFQSDTERRFAILLEDDLDEVVKWFKPGKDAFHIYYKGDGGDVPYEPDFVVETKTAKLICETKAVKDMETDEVKNKARAAVKWCEYATDHENQVGGKPWSYLLIPHDAVDGTKTLQGLAAAYTLKAPKGAAGI
jgi:type III restriction enzyme